MVNNILSILNLILVVTALVIAIVALTNRNKDTFENNLGDDPCLISNFCKGQTNYPPSCQSINPNQSMQDYINKSGAPRWQCCWKDGLPPSGGEGVVTSDRPCGFNEEQTVCYGEGDEMKCGPGYYCDPKGGCTIAPSSGDCNVQGEGGTDINKCYSSAYNCKKYDKDCKAPVPKPFHIDDFVWVNIRQQNSKKWYTIEAVEDGGEEICKYGDVKANKLCNGNSQPWACIQMLQWFGKAPGNPSPLSVTIANSHYTRPAGGYPDYCGPGGLFVSLRDDTPSPSYSFTPLQWGGTNDIKVFDLKPLDKKYINFNKIYENVEYYMSYPKIGYICLLSGTSPSDLPILTINADGPGTERNVVRFVKAPPPLS